MPAKGPTPIRTAAKYITRLLRKLSELASCTNWLSSQKKWGICISGQKDNHNTIKLCSKEFKAKRTQDVRTSSPQSLWLAGGSWWPCSAGGGRWPHTDHRPSHSGECHPILQTVCKNTSGWCSFIGDTFALCLDIPQHLWDGGGNETEVYKG